jgi:DNA repair/transcription protein MET18/MMS19
MRAYAQERTFEQYREALMDTLREGLRTEGLKEPAVRGCVALVEIPGFWGRGEVEDVVKGMDDALLNDKSSEVKLVRSDSR